MRAQGGVLWKELNRETAIHGLAVAGGAIFRGGGGNFGIATSFEYRLHPLSMVTGGLIAHPFAAARDVLRFYRDQVTSASDDLTVFAGVVHAPDGSGVKLVAMIVFHTGPPEEAQRELAPYLEFGSPAVVHVEPMPYQVMNTLLDANYPTGSLNYWLSSFTDDLSDALIDTIADRFESVPSPMSADLLLPSVWLDPATTDANIAWTRETHAALAPHRTQRRWLNYLGDDQDGEAIRSAYGPNYDRLLELKRRYDPENVFHHNHNIVP